MKHFTAEDIRRLREETGMDMQAARRELACQEADRLINSPFWFLHLRDLLRYLINRI